MGPLKIDSNKNWSWWQWRNRFFPVITLFRFLLLYFYIYHRCSPPTASLLPLIKSSLNISSHRNDADSKSFREDMEHAAKQTETSVPTEGEKMFRSAILKAGYKNIGLKKVGSTKRIRLTKKIREAIGFRGSLKPDRHRKPNEFKQTDTRLKRQRKTQ